MSKAGTLYITSPTNDGISRLVGNRTEPVLTDTRLRWPDTFSEGADGRIYVTAGHIQDTSWFQARRTGVDQDAALLVRARQVRIDP